MARIIALLVATLTVAGCNLFGGDETVEPPAELVSFESSLPVKKLWSVDVGGEDEELRLALRPVVLDDRVLAASPRGEIRALDRERGRTLWQIKTGLRLSGGVAASESLAVVGTLDGEVLALDPASGSTVWRSEVSSEVLSPAAVGNEIVVVRSQDGRVFGFAAGSGARQWVFDQSTPTLTLRGTSPPVLAGGFAFIGFDNGKLYALRARDGSLAWEATVGAPSGRTELDRMVDVDGELAVVGGDLYAVGFHGRLVALSADAGRPAWTREFSSSTGVSIARRQLYLTDGEDSVWALDRLSGADVWRQQRLARRQLTTPVQHGDAVVVGDLEGYLHWLSGTDGTFVARARIGNEPILAPPIVDGDVLYVASQSGRLTALRVN